MITCTAEQAGTYLVVAPGIRVQRPGRPHLSAIRPRASKEGAYTDTVEPTLITIDEGDLVDVAALLALGAVQHWTPALAAEYAARPPAQPRSTRERR